MTQQTNKGTALITGASSGIGAIYADRLAARGYELILVARNEARLHDMADRVQQAHGRKVTIVQADLGERDDLARVEGILKSDPAITLLVNNAGFGGVTPLLESNVDRMEQMIDINVTAPTRLTYAAAPPFVARGGGTIINIASIVAIGTEILVEEGKFVCKFRVAFPCGLLLQTNLPTFAGRQTCLHAALEGKFIYTQLYSS